MYYVFGDFSLDTARYELRRAGEVVPLRGKVFDVLAYLVTFGEIEWCATYFCEQCHNQNPCGEWILEHKPLPGPLLNFNNIN
jgi:DNA-binding response OmpR family regulator